MVFSVTLCGCLSDAEYNKDKTAFYYNAVSFSGSYYLDTYYRNIQPDTGVSRGYTEYYKQLPLPEYTYSWEYLSSAGYRIYKQNFINRNSQAVVLLIHGYFTHSGTYSKTIERLLRMNYSVITVDLPGHGLSSGPRGDIESFRSYGIVVQDLISSVKSEGKPLYAIGHSTGASAIMEYMLALGGNELDSVVLACPLVQTSWWKLTNLLYKVLDPFKEHFKTGQDVQDFTDFSDIPFSWFSSLREWNEVNSEYGISRSDVLLIHAENDEVVSNTASLAYVKEHFPVFKHYTAKNSSHSIFKEGDKQLDQLMWQIEQHFETPSWIVSLEKE